MPGPDHLAADLAAMKVHSVMPPTDRHGQPSSLSRPYYDMANVPESACHGLSHSARGAVGYCLGFAA
jgi:hypothetical protein